MIRRVIGGGAILLALAALFTACAKKATAPPPEPSPLGVIAVQPPARSAGYAYDGQIWALFDRPLDPKTVDTTTVFLKRDTRRLSCTVGYEPTSRRIVIVPRAALSLDATYTVIVTPLVKGRDGSSLAQDYFWQFSTTSIGRLVYQDPAPGVLATPVAMLRWSSPGALPGQLVFDVYEGLDSTAVQNRTAARLTTTGNAYFLPLARWPEGRRVYWAVTTTNTATGERQLSPVASFDVLPADAPTHVVTSGVIEWGAVQAGRATTQYCAQSYVPVGLQYNSAIRLDLPATIGTRVKSARLEMYATGGYSATPDGSLWSCLPSWNACTIDISGPPSPDTNGALATALPGYPGYRLVFDSPGLAAWVEGMMRHGDFSGLIVRHTVGSTTNLNMRGVTTSTPVLTVTVYD